MTMRTLVTFNTDLPDDAIETADGMDFIQWPGRNVAEVMAELLKSMGWTPDGPFCLEHAGWDLDASLGAQGITLRSEVIEEVIVGITDRTPDLTWYLKPKPPGPVFVGMLIGLDATMKADGRFRDILWFTAKGYSSQTEAGSPVPVEVEG